MGGQTVSPQMDHSADRRIDEIFAMIYRCTYFSGKDDMPLYPFHWSVIIMVIGRIVSLIIRSKVLAVRSGTV